MMKEWERDNGRQDAGEGPKKCGDFFGDLLFSGELRRAPFAASASRRLNKCWGLRPFSSMGCLCAKVNWL